VSKSNLKTQIKKLPQSPGVYIFYDNTGKTLYVGKSVSIKKRVASYFSQKKLGPKTDLLVRQIHRISYVKVFSEFEALLLESDLIKTNQPFFNVQSKDDKSPLYIKISGKPIPAITTTRRQEGQKGIFLKGPFPSAAKTREVLRLVRRVFPFCHHKNPKRPCLYVHLGLCPYPHASPQSQKFYLHTIQKIKKLLSGQTSSLVKLLHSEMANFSKNMEYEKAQIVKKQIENIEYILRKYHKPQEFLEQPTLVDDIVAAKLKNLKEELNLKNLPKRIECYDISNISGKNATGSMIVFVNGKPEKGQYRRFKIEFSNKPNDYEMIRETIKRRFKNNWPKPHLIIIDGGRGQLNAACSILTKYHQKIPVIAIAKKLETIYAWNKILPINLPKESLARILIQAARDEAHRFAIVYHHLLRSKQLLGSKI